MKSEVKPHVLGSMQDIFKLQSTPVLKFSIVDETVSLSFRGTMAGVVTDLTALSRAAVNTMVHIKGVVATVEPIGFTAKEEPMRRFQVVDSQGWAAPVCAHGAMASDESIEVGKELVLYYGKIQGGLRAGDNGTIWLYGVSRLRHSSSEYFQQMPCRCTCCIMDMSR